MYKIISLTANQVEKIYNEHMVNDFPATELKPLPMILKGMKNKTYECLGFVEAAAEEILAYAVFIKNDKNYLFDYLAVIDGCRNSGIGSNFLKSISEYYKDADSIIGEVEDPEFALSEVERDLQNRRIGFYMRNNFVDTNVKAKLWGVDFKIIEMNPKKEHSREEIVTLYKSHYRKILPWFFYISKVKIK